MHKLLCLTAASSSAADAALQRGGADFTAVFLIISIIVAVALPFSLLLYAKIKCKGSFVMPLWGMIGYVVFYVLISSLIGSIVLTGYSDQNATYFEGTVLIVLQIVCMEAGRYLILRFTHKKHNNWGDALMLSAGYCIFDTIVIAVFFLVPYLFIVLSPDGGSLDGMWRAMRVYVQDSNLVAGKEWRFIVKSLTSIVFCAMQISSTMLMYIAVYKKEKWMLLLPFAVDALIMIPNRLSSFDVWYFGNNFVIIPYLAVMAVLCCLFTYIMYKKVYKRKNIVMDTSYIDKLKDVKPK